MTRNPPRRSDSPTPSSRKLELIPTKKNFDEAIPAIPEEEPRVFALKMAFYQQRIDKKKNAEIAKRNRERLQNPNLFPKVPNDLH